MATPKQVTCKVGRTYDVCGERFENGQRLLLCCEVSQDHGYWTPAELVEPVHTCPPEYDDVVTAGFLAIFGV
jgi:hypothetical protein